MAPYSSYVICGTPRSGSTLLCEMLAATNVAGRPNSYFRPQDILYWAERWGVPTGIEAVDFERLYLSAMLREGSNETGIFGLRLMWSSIAEAARRLNSVNGGEADIAASFEQAFGHTLYIHLSRQDKVGQAISLVRAEQSGLWHLAADGSVLEGTTSPLPVTYDGDRIATVFGELESDDAAWDDFFRTRHIEPLRLVYETVTADPQSALASILEALGRDPDIASTVATGTARMANATSLEWSARFRRDHGLPQG